MEGINWSQRYQVMPEPNEPKDSNEQTEFEKFNELAKKLFAVPYSNIKDEVKKEEQGYRESPDQKEKESN